MLLGDVHVALGDARLRPVLREHDNAIGVQVHRQLDPHLVH